MDTNIDSPIPPTAAGLVHALESLKLVGKLHDNDGFSLWVNLTKYWMRNNHEQ